jgi:oxygen-independent coproporphyrinogen-3 oxidase
MDDAVDISGASTDTPSMVDSANSVPSEGLSASERAPYGALYIHVPFCHKRCSYCDFATEAVPSTSSRLDTYTDMIVRSIHHASQSGDLSHIQTVYLGGGTPTYLGLRRLTSILYMLSLSMRLEPDVECSMEANPDSLTEPMVKDLWALGVNRISIGVQSFDDEVLQTLGRIHTAQQASDAIACAHTRFKNVSVDLMCGIPGQTTESFRSSVRRAIALGVTHVSVYPLTIEEGTPFDRMQQRGELAAVSDDLQAEQMVCACQELESAGFHRYEVASYARDGYECRHNCAYWTGIPYLGLGPSAVSMQQSDRRRVRLKDGVVVDSLDNRERCAEDLMLGMRMSGGVTDTMVGRAQILLPDVTHTLADLQSQGLITHNGSCWCPTDRGWLCGNELYGALYNLAP